MAQCQQTAEEFILDVFSPLVAVLCSSDVESVCQKNNLSFVELIQPFCRLNTEAHIRDSNNVAHAIRNLHIVVHDMNAVQPPAALLSQKMLNDVVSEALPQYTSGVDLLPKTIISVGNHDLQLSASTPWFEAYREAFLQISYPSDHEFIRHYLACMFVVSSSHADPMEEFSRLTQHQHSQQHQQPHKLPKWFSPNILRYYVLVHDVTEQSEAKAESVFQMMKSRFGIYNCHLLHINSSGSSVNDGTSAEHEALPNPWSRFVSRKHGLDETVEYEPLILPEENNSAFPGHVTEDSLGVSQMAIDIDSALEAVEVDTNTTIDHPLAPASRSRSLDVLCHVDGSLSSNELVPSAPNGTDGVLSTDETPLTADGPVTKPVSARTPSAPVSHGAHLTLSDHECLRVFIQEFVMHGLIPWAEKTIRTLNEQVTTRKGIHRSFLSATKKWFGGSKPTNPAVITNNTNVIYTAEAPEMQMRRLADLAFMFRLYELAYQMYHAAKKDFNNEHAWLHLAGAMEMACLSVFMQGSASPRAYQFHYMDSTITTYLTICKVPHFATRAALLSTEILKNKGMYAEAAAQLIKMTSEESDLRSALLLEQAAHCFIKMRTPMIRKYAFHMILAGHRFNKAWQKRHALRAYAQAMQVYKGRGWSLAEDHINFTIGCQSFNLKQMDVATSAFKHLLSANSKQSLTQQTAFLREYLTVFRQLGSQPSTTDAQSSTKLPQLPLPVIETNSIKVLCGSLPIGPVTGSRIAASGVSFSDSESENATFAKLEELMLVAQRCKSSGRLTNDCFTSRTNNTHCPVTAVGEPITVELAVVNPLKVALMLRDLTLLWRFVPPASSDPVMQHFTDKLDSDSRPLSYSNDNEFCLGKVNSELVECQSVNEVQLDGAERKLLHLVLIPRCCGELHIHSLAFRLGSAANSLLPDSVTVADSSATSPTTISGFVTLEVQGPRLNNTKAERTGLLYAPDRRLSPLITDQLPKLEVFFCQFPSRLLCGEVRQVVIEFVNTGPTQLHNLTVASTHPEFLTFGTSASTAQPSHASGAASESWPSTVYPVLDTSVSGSTVVTRSPCGYVYNLPVGVRTTIEPGETVRLSAWVRGPDVAGEHSIHFLFCYEPTKKVPHVKRRVVRHTAHIAVYQSLSVRAVAGRHTPSTADSSALNSVVIALEVENVNTIQDSSLAEFTIMQVSCASQCWQLQPLSQLKTSDGKVCSRECSVFALQATKSAQQSAASSQTTTDVITFTDVPLTSLHLDCATSVASDFYFRSHLSCLLVAEPAGGDGVSQSATPAVSRVELQSVGAELEQAIAVDLTLIVLWKTSLLDHAGRSSVIVGQHSVVLTQLNLLASSPKIVKPPVDQPPVKIINSPSSTVAPRPSAELTSQLVHYSLRYPSTVSHDFTKQRLCVVQVTLKLFNSSGIVLRVDIDTRVSHNRSTAVTEQSSQSSPSTDNAPYHESPLKSFVWAGPTFERITLSPGSMHVIQQRACFVSTGMYNLNLLRVSAGTLTDIEMVPQRAASAAPIVIHEATAPDDAVEIC